MSHMVERRASRPSSRATTRLSIGSEDSSGCGRRGEPRLYTKDGRNRLGLNRIDLLIIAAYLAGITLFGLRFRKRQRTMRDYFLADRNISWWAISLSIVAAETSTLTIISIPGLAYDSNL